MGSNGMPWVCRCSVTWVITPPPFAREPSITRIHLRGPWQFSARRGRPAGARVRPRSAWPAKRWDSFAGGFSLPETVILEIANNLLTKVQDVALHRQAGAVLVASSDGPGDGLMLVEVEDLGVNVAGDRQAHVLHRK